MAKIKDIQAVQILDSRGNPTIETTVFLDDNSAGTAACPSGASTGTFEAFELRDNNPEKFNGLGVTKAIDNIHTIIAPKLIGIDAEKQQNVDRIMIELDGTPNKAKLGANAILSISMAVCKAAAKSANIALFLFIRQFINMGDSPLKIPIPLFNVINGGKHAGENLELQEFLLIPASSTPYPKALEIGFKVYKSLMALLGQNNFLTLVGDEGGFGPRFNSNEEALSYINQSINASAMRLGFDVFLGIDAAANSFFKDKFYHIKDAGKNLNAKDLINYYQQLNAKYHILYLEDPLAEDAWNDWAVITEKMSQSSLIVGDDLTVTNSNRLQTAIDKKAITGIIIKPNQIGTVMETLAVVKLARSAGIKIIVSHRSGETNDDFIADLAVAVSADYAKFGAPARGERVAKYNRLLQIERHIRELENVVQPVNK